MKRSIFFLLASILGLLFGGMMLLVPEKAAEGFGLVASSESALLIRSMGGMITAAAVLNFLVRHHPDSTTLAAVLIFNIVFHAFGLLADLIGLSQGIIMLNKIIGGQVAHLFVGIGSLIYLMKIKNKAA